MSSFAPFLLILSSLALVSIGRGEERAPHGIAYESPMAFSPSAYDFFHPKTPCVASTCSPLPVAAQVDGSKALASKVSSGQGVGAGGVAAGIVFGLAFAVLLAMGVYYVLNTRRVNANRANSVQPDA
ncbi:LOW QUALITY PROTEIN: uncharacterized protein LOC105788940 [Gossypium raimondii]|uniref:LOW QUALITY PROTEIN: uncharacterized protein LOC105788940 n=1 Tax=Gossypium raimondii TaxID=29730 RepID=UPI00063AF51A|nr:LOW QUALITY PROTEIN: uncharacterized protein LOC105788940 [Gossypium raimondii]